jgi:hypothetical protein
MNLRRTFATVSAVGALCVVAVPASAQAGCTGSITPDSFEFSCSNAMPSPPDPDGASFQIGLKTDGEVLSGSVTAPAGFSCDVVPSHTGRLGTPVPSSLNCAAPDVTVPAGSKVTGTWQLSSADACKPGATLSTNAYGDDDDSNGSLTCRTAGDQPGAGGGSGGSGQPGATKCMVPKLKGRTLAAAKKRLAKAHCGVGKITKKKGPRSKKGIVLAQQPKPGTVKPAGSKVKLVVGK